jgi:hypothetical protein
VGGWRCRECGKAVADLAEAMPGWDCYVDPMVRGYDRKHGAMTRSERWVQ